MIRIVRVCSHETILGISGAMILLPPAVCFWRERGRSMSRKLRMKCMGLFVACCLLLQGNEFLLAQTVNIPSESEAAEESYAKGQALVMYEVQEEKDTKITLYDVMSDTSDYVVEESYSFDYGKDEVCLEEYGEEEDNLVVSLVS